MGRRGKFEKKILRIHHRMSVLNANLFLVKKAILEQTSKDKCTRTATIHRI